MILEWIRCNFITQCNVQDINNIHIKAKLCYLHKLHVGPQKDIVGCFWSNASQHASLLTADVMSSSVGFLATVHSKQLATGLHTIYGEFSELYW